MTDGKQISKLTLKWVSRAWSRLLRREYQCRGGQKETKDTDKILHFVEVQEYVSVQYCSSPFWMTTNETLKMMISNAEKIIKIIYLLIKNFVYEGEKTEENIPISFFLFSLTVSGNLWFVVANLPVSHTFVLLKLPDTSAWNSPNIKRLNFGYTLKSITMDGILRW